MTALSVLLEGGGSGTWVGTMSADDPLSWRRLGPLDSHAGGDAVGAQVAQLVLGATAPLGGTPALVLAALSTVTSAASATEIAGNIAAVVSRAGSPHDPACTVMTCNDILPLLSWQAGAASVAAICGTGTGYAARDRDGTIRRASGAEYILSDEGGGFDLGLSGLRAATRGWDGRGPGTTLTEAALELGGGTFEGLWAFVYEQEAEGLKQRVATFAPRVLHAATQGDDVAGEIVSAAADHLTNGIRAVLRTIVPSEATLTMAGSVLCSPAGDVLRLRLIDKLSSENITFGTSLQVRDAREQLVALRSGLLNGSTDLQGFTQLDGTVPAAVAR